MYSSEDDIVVDALMGDDGAAAATIPSRVRLRNGSLRVEPHDPSVRPVDIPFGSIRSIDAIGGDEAGWQEVEIESPAGYQRRLRWPAYFTSMVTEALATHRRPEHSGAVGESRTNEQFSPHGGIADQMRLLNNLRDTNGLTSTEFAAARAQLVATALPPGAPVLERTCALGVLALGALAAGADEILGLSTNWVYYCLFAYFLILTVGSQMSREGRPFGIAALPLAAALSLTGSLQVVTGFSLGLTFTSFGRVGMIWTTGSVWLITTLVRRQVQPWKSFDLSGTGITGALALGGVTTLSWAIAVTDWADVRWQDWVYGFGIGTVVGASIFAALTDRSPVMRLAWGTGTTALLLFLLVRRVPLLEYGSSNWPLALLLAGTATSLGLTALSVWSSTTWRADRL